MVKKAFGQKSDDVDPEREKESWLNNARNTLKVKKQEEYDNTKKRNPSATSKEN